jgi:hypothetical protein
MEVGATDAPLLDMSDPARLFKLTPTVNRTDARRRKTAVVIHTFLAEYAEFETR